MARCGISLTCLSTVFLGMMLGFSILLIHSMLLTERQRLEILENEILDQQAEWKAQWEQARASAQAAQDSEATYLHNELERFEKEVESELGIAGGARPAALAQDAPAAPAVPAAPQVPAVAEAPAPAFEQAPIVPAVPEAPQVPQVAAEVPEPLAPMVDDYAAAAAPAAPASEAAAPAPAYEPTAPAAPVYEPAAPAPAFEAAPAAQEVPAYGVPPQDVNPGYGAAAPAAPVVPGFGAAPAFGNVPAPQGALPYGAVLPAGAIGVGLDGQPIYQIPTFDPAPKTVDQIMVGLHERIKRRKTMPKTQHLPSFIIIGVKKCGTSALSRFLKIHPDLASAGETFFFANNFKDGLDYYKSKMPNTTDDVLSYEKTPNYYRLPVVPDRVRNFQSQVSKLSGVKKEIKMIYVTCDPVRRTLSDFLHSRTNDAGSEPSPGEFEAFIGERFSKMESEMASIKAEQGDLWHDEVYKMYKERRDWFNYTDPISNLIVNGAYSVFYKRWLENFDQRQLLVVDGTEMISNPGGVIVQTQQFLNIERIIDEKNFIFDEERGYYCYTRTGDDTKYCIKGQQKSPSKTMSEDMRQRLFNFFEPFSQKLAGDLGREPFNWNWNPAL